MRNRPWLLLVALLVVALILRKGTEAAVDRVEAEGLSEGETPSLVGSARITR